MFPVVSPIALIEVWTVAIARYAEPFWLRFREEAIQTVDRLRHLPDIEETFEEHLITLRAEPSYFSEEGNISIFFEELCQVLCLTPDDQDWSRLYATFIEPVQRFLHEINRLFTPVLEPLSLALYQRLTEFMFDLPSGEDVGTTSSARSSPGGSELSLGSGDITIGSALSTRTLSGLSYMATQGRRLSF